MRGIRVAVNAPGNLLNGSKIRVQSRQVGEAVWRLAFPDMIVAPLPPSLTYRREHTYSGTNVER